MSAGDRVIVISPSWGGPGAIPTRYEAGKRQLAEALEVEVVESRHALRSPEWIEANPQARAEDLMEAFVDARATMIIASIGGDDADRLVPFIDTSVLTRHPKIFVGYSDTTTLHFGCFHAGLVSFYGPSVMSGFGENGGLIPYMLDGVKKAICSTEPIGEIAAAPGWTVEHLPWEDPAHQRRRRTLVPNRGPRLLRGHGVHRGHLLGGCADTLERVKATAWWPPLERWRGALLFYETSEEAPAPSLVAHWLRDYAARGILQVLSGILFARPGGRIDPARHPEWDAAILAVFDEVGLPDLPVLANLDFGHTDPMFTIPYGVHAELDCEAARLRVLEPAVV